MWTPPVIIQTSILAFLMLLVLIGCAMLYRNVDGSGWLIAASLFLIAAGDFSAA